MSTDDPRVGFIRSAPEELFGVEIAIGQGRTEGAMPLGRWLRGADDRFTAGSLGVLVDDTCGYAVNSAVPGGAWSTTTELSLTMLRLPPASGPLHTEGVLAHLDRRGGLARGVFRDGRGEVVAFGHARNRFVSDGPPADAVATGRRDHGLDLPAPGEAEDLLSVLGDVVAGESGVEVVVGPRLGNPRGGLHGGVSLCLCDLTAGLAVPGLLTTGVVVHFLRPVPLGTRLILEPVVRHRGRSLAVVEVAARREDGATCVRATVTRE